MTLRKLFGFTTLPGVVVFLLAGCGCDPGPGGMGGMSSTGTGGHAGTGGGPGSNPACAPFEATPPVTSPVTVRLVNKTSANLYLGQTTGGCASGSGFTLQDASQKALQTSLGMCDFTCGALTTSTCACSKLCGTPEVTELAPGAGYDIAWPGTVLTAETMPAACYSDPDCTGTACVMETKPPAGPLTVSASGWTQATGCGGACSPCQAGSSGTCVVSGAMTVGGTEIKGSAAWNGEASVEIDLQ